MSLATLLLASLLLVDPSGDAHGAGDLTRPTAGVYSSTAPFDLVEVEVLEGRSLTLRVRLAERPNPGDLPNGITLPVIDLYVDSEEGGAEELLPGPGLRMPAEGGWEVAIRVTGDTAFARRAADGAEVVHPVTVTPDGDVLLIATPFEAPERTPRVHALSGVYDAFDADAWRPLTRTPSPWAFSSETARFPVVDVLAEDDAAQAAALTSGVLPEGRSADPAAPWLVLMVLGLVIAFAGLLLRSRVGRLPAEEAPTTTDAGDVPPAARTRPAREEHAEGTRVYDVDTDHAAPLWSFGAAEDAVDDGTGGHEPDAGSAPGSADDPAPVGRGTAAPEASGAPLDGPYDEAMLGPRRTESETPGGEAAATPAGGSAADDAEAAAPLSESDLFDPSPAGGPDARDDLADDDEVPVAAPPDDGPREPEPFPPGPAGRVPEADAGEAAEDDPPGDDARRHAPTPAPSDGDGR